MISNDLIKYIKDVLASRPLDIYSEEDETVSHSSYELLASRENISYLDGDYDTYDDEGNDLTKAIGSANLFIAAALVCKEITGKLFLPELETEEHTIFDNEWNSLIQNLIDERFMREIKLIAQSKIKLVVNNE